MRPLVLLLFAVTTSQAQWIVGFYTAGEGQPISEVPWNKLTHLHLCCAAAGVNGSLSQNWLIASSFAEIRTAAQAAGVKVILSITDSAVPTNYFPSNTAPGTVDLFVNSI